MKKIINDNDCTKINEFKGFSKEINEKKLYHFEITSNQILSSSVDLLDLPADKLAENFLILKDIKNIYNLEPEIQENIQKEKILKFAKNILYVCFGAAAGFFVINLFQGKSFLPLASLATDRILQKQKEKIKETFTEKSPSIIKKSLNLVKINVKKIKKQSFSFIKNKTEKTSEIVKYFLQKNINLKREFWPPEVLQNNLLKEKGKKELIKLSEENLIKHSQKINSEKIKNNIIGGSANSISASMLLAAAALVKIGKNILKFVIQPKNIIKNDSENFKTTNVSEFQKIPNKENPENPENITKKSQNLYGISISIWQHIIANADCYVAFIFFLSLMITLYTDKIDNETSFLDIINNLIKKLQNLITRKELPDWISEVQQQKDRIARIRAIYKDKAEKAEKGIENDRYMYSFPDPERTAKPIEDVPIFGKLKKQKDESKFSNIELEKNAIPKVVNQKDFFKNLQDERDEIEIIDLDLPEDFVLDDEL